MLDERTRAHIVREIRQIDQLFQEYEDLLQKARQREPGLVELTALGAVLHSFYTGVESIFQTVAKRVDEHMPSGDQWHRELLLQMVREGERRGEVISQATRETLEAYLGFRHVYRHAYSFRLTWPQMRRLVYDLPDVWARLKSEIQANLELSV